MYLLFCLALCFSFAYLVLSAILVLFFTLKCVFITAAQSKNGFEFPIWTKESWSWISGTESCWPSHSRSMIFLFPCIHLSWLRNLCSHLKLLKLNLIFLIREIYFVCSHAKLIFVRMLSAIDQLSVVLVIKALYSVTPFLLHCWK
jgi:hypothetical protein